MTAMLQGAGKIKVPALLLIGGLIVKISANLILVPLYDITGAAIAGNIGFAGITLGLVLYFKKVWPIRLADARFYGWVMAATVLMIVVVLPWMVLADSVFIRRITKSVWLDGYRPHICYGRRGRFPLSGYEITYNG